jgi:hypothetical protein
MFRNTVLTALVIVLASRPGLADDPPPQDKPKDPFEKAPAGKVSTETTDQGLLVLSNLEGNHYTYQLTGKVKKLDYEDKDNPDKRIWEMDGIILQSIPVPLAKEVDQGYAEEIVSKYLDYENEYQAKEGYKEVKSARAWLSLGNGESALYWELSVKKKEGTQKILYASAVNGRNIITFAATVFPDMDEAKAKKLLVGAVSSLKRYEKAVTGYLYPGDASAMLINDELAGREDRKIPGAFILEPEKLILLMRMTLELAPDSYMIGLHDGHKGHVVTMHGYDRAKRGMLYTDTWGAGHSFLQEDNNRAGVKAIVTDEGFLVNEGELQNVLTWVLKARWSAVRPYFVTRTWEETAREYRVMRLRYPDSPELSEEFLLKAGYLLLEGNEPMRAANLLAICIVFHDKSSRALAAVAAAYARLDKPDSALKCYGEAVDGLADDPKVSEAQRPVLAAGWEVGRVTILMK